MKKKRSYFYMLKYNLGKVFKKIPRDYDIGYVNILK